MDGFGNYQTKRRTNIISYHLCAESKENDTTRVFALGAYSYGYYGGSFDFRADYFLIDNAGNYASLEERNLLRYIADEIDEPYFLNWLFENGYISDEEYKRLQWDLSY